MATTTTTEQFSLRWNNFHSNLTSGFHELLEAAEMVDVTLAVEGHFIQAHKVVLSICSPYFRQMFKVNPCKHPIVILKDVAHENIKDILEFMYMGEVNVLRENLSSFLRTAELLQVKGLTGDDSQSDSSSRKDEKSDGFGENEEDLMQQYNQLIDSDMELPAHYSSPTSSQPPASPPQAPPPPPPPPHIHSTKRQRHIHHASQSLKRPKSESSCSSSSSSNQVIKTTTATMPAKTEEQDEAEYVESSLNPDHKSETGPESKDNGNGAVAPSVPNDSPSDQGRTSNSSSGQQSRSNNYQCEKCSKKFSRRDHLRTHEKNIHGEDAGPFVCVICSQLYKNTESLRKHIAKFHFPKINELNPKVEVKA